MDIVEVVENGMIERVQAITREESAALNRPFQEYPLYPLYAEGWFTPLAFAVSQGQTEMVRWLLENGAESNRHSPEGQSLLHLAGAKRHEAIVDLLRPSST